MGEDGEQINLEIPPTPWYLGEDRKRMRLKYEGKWKCKSENFREYACKNCGALTHDTKSCRQTGAKWTVRYIDLSEIAPNDGERDHVTSS